jgi:polysaccharide export outer membrane protein
MHFYKIFILIFLNLFLLVPTCSFSAGVSENINTENHSFFDKKILNDGGNVYHTIIHVGDTLEIKVFNEKDLSGTYLVDRSGKVFFPLIGDLKIEGLDVDAAKKNLVERLKQYLIDPQVSIIHKPSASEAEKEKVVILGAVKTPGSYPGISGMTILKLIGMAGDLTSDADLNNVSIIRTNKNGAKEILRLDIEKILKGIEKDVLINNSDIIFITKKELLRNKFVNLIGQVKKPGAYPYRDELSLLALIAMAGDFTETANLGQVRVIRKNSDKNEVMTVDIEKIFNGEMPDFILEPNDVIRVMELPANGKNVKKKFKLY